MTTNRTPEQIAEVAMLEYTEENGAYEDEFAARITATIAAREAQTTPNFAPEGEPDKFRDLWNDNMPRVSGRMWFAIPGEQPIHLPDDLARFILVTLSKEV